MSQFFVSVASGVLVALVIEVGRHFTLRRHEHEALKTLLREALREHHQVSVDVDGEHWEVE